MTLIVSSRPEYESCSIRMCGKSLRYKDYIAVLAEAGVDPNRLVKDLLLDPNSCCTKNIIKDIPKPEKEYVDRLLALKSITLKSPPEFYLSYPGEEVRPVYRKTKIGGMLTYSFIGAEPYYYLVERGEKPETVLSHLQIRDPEDIRKIVNITDRPATEFECPYCEEYIPHAKFLSHLYKTRKEQTEALLERPDIMESCCKEAVIGIKLSEHERNAAELQAKELERQFSGIPISKEPLTQCISCGASDVTNYYDYEWLVHKGIPPIIALNYFGLYRICCRQTMINPRLVPSESKALVIRRLTQENEMPIQETNEFDYLSNILPSISGNI